MSLHNLQTLIASSIVPAPTTSLQVHMLVRGDKLRASKTMQDRALSSPKITVHFNTEVEDATGDELLDGLIVVNNKTGAAETPSGVVCGVPPQVH